MIHRDARLAVGWIGGGGDDGPVGHAVLIGPGAAITCAHVISTAEEKPTADVDLRFPNLDLHVSATIAAWSPYDPSLSAGSDLALLHFAAEDLPADAWARLDNDRPRYGDALAALEFQTARQDGDVRGGEVVDGSGDVLSVNGDRFIEPGMSGGGLFHPAPGERLVGLVSGRPLAAHQTTGYAIPADEIARFVAEAASLDGEDPRCAAQALVAMAVGAIGPNMRGLVEPFVDAAVDVLSRPTEAWTEADLHDLVDLQLEVADAVDPADAAAGSQRLAGVFAKLDALLARLPLEGPAAGDLVPLDGEMERALRTARDEIDRLVRDGPCPDAAREPMQGLARVIGAALERESIRLCQLSRRSELARRRCEGAFATGARTLMACIGRRAELAPPGSVFCDVEAAWAPTMVIVPEGRFTMGSPDDEEDRFDDEGPRREVSVARFALARTPLTFAAYDAYCAVTGRDPPGDEGWGRGDRPAINVSWTEARAFIDWLNAQLSAARYRLPSESEWEYAARAGSDTAYPWGETWDASMANGGDGGPGRTAPVGSFPSNAFGLLDMIGNVLEWTEDVWHETYDGAPTDGSSWIDVQGDDQARRVVRGGSWYDYPRFLRSADRYGLEPEERVDSLGFRPARTLLTP